MTSKVLQESVKLEIFRSTKNGDAGSGPYSHKKNQVGSGVRQEVQRWPCRVTIAASSSPFTRRPFTEKHDPNTIFEIPRV
jgi:hypothetical protein